MFIFQTLCVPAVPRPNGLLPLSNYDPVASLHARMEKTNAHFIEVQRNISLWVSPDASTCSPHAVRPSNVIDHNDGRLCRITNNLPKVGDRGTFVVVAVNKGVVNRTELCEDCR